MNAEEQFPDSPVSADEIQKIAPELEKLRDDLLAFASRFKGRTGVDQRWLAIGMTDVEKGVTFISKAILEGPLVAAIVELEKAMKD